jgi:hypothetical protein
MSLRVVLILFKLKETFYKYCEKGNIMELREGTLSKDKKTGEEVRSRESSPRPLQTDQITHMEQGSQERPKTVVEQVAAMAERIMKPELTKSREDGKKRKANDQAEKEIPHKRSRKDLTGKNPGEPLLAIIKHNQEQEEIQGILEKANLELEANRQKATEASQEQQPLTSNNPYDPKNMIGSLTRSFERNAPAQANILKSMFESPTNKGSYATNAERTVSVGTDITHPGIAQPQYERPSSFLTKRENTRNIMPKAKEAPKGQMTEEAQESFYKALREFNEYTDKTEKEMIKNSIDTSAFIEARYDMRYEHFDRQSNDNEATLVKRIQDERKNLQENLEEFDKFTNTMVQEMKNKRLNPPDFLVHRNILKYETEKKSTRYIAALERQIERLKQLDVARIGSTGTTDRRSPQPIDQGGGDHQSSSHSSDMDISSTPPGSSTT